MKVKIYVNKKHLEDFNKFYNKVNNNEIFDKAEIPILDIKETIKLENQKYYNEVFLYYDIYITMKYVFIEKHDELIKSKMSKEESNVLKIFDSLLQKAAQTGNLATIVMNAMDNITNDIYDSKTIALQKAIDDHFEELSKL